MAPEGRFGKIFEIFEILGGAGDINNSTSMSITEMDYIATLIDM